MSLDQIECGACGYRLSHINQPCPNCLPGFYQGQFTARMESQPMKPHDLAEATWIKMTNPRLSYAEQIKVLREAFNAHAQALLTELSKGDWNDLCRAANISTSGIEADRLRAALSALCRKVSAL